MSKWTLFWDMHSGGGTKEGDYDKIYIEAPENEAKIIFYKRFGHNPDRVSCTCCGPDYSIDERDSLAQASAFHRNCGYVYRNASGKVVDKNKAWKPGIGIVKGYKVSYEDVKESIPLSEYVKHKTVLVIYKDQIKDSERTGTIPEQGYVGVE